jgi:hypothetical protein
MAKTHKPITEELPEVVTEQYKVESYDTITPAAETSDPQLKYAPTFDVQKLSKKCPANCLFAYPSTKPQKVICIGAGELTSETIKEIKGGEKEFYHSWGSTTDVFVVITHKLQ